MEYILTNILLGLLEYPGSTLLGVNRMLVDKDFRNTIVNNISDPSVKAFWTEEYAKYTDKFAAEAAPAIQNKVGQFVANPLVRNIIGQSKSSFDIRDIMDNKKIFIVNLSKGRVGEGNANLLGAMIITKIYLAAMSRADLSEAELKKVSQFYLYVDEFQSFANESFADILSEARKYKLNLTIAHQYVEQMTEEVRAAVFGNVGTMAIFRVGAYDADIFQKEFAPQFSAEDIVNLQQYQMYLKLMIDGVTSTPFSGKGMPPIPRPERIYVQEIIDASRSQFAKGRIEIEDEIRRWHVEKIKPVGQAAQGQGSGYPSEGGTRAQASSGYGSTGGGGKEYGPSGQSHGAGSHGGQARDNQGYEPRPARQNEGQYDKRPRSDDARRDIRDSRGPHDSRDSHDSRERNTAPHLGDSRRRESEQPIRHEPRAQGGDRDRDRSRGDQPARPQFTEPQQIPSSALSAASAQTEHDAPQARPQRDDKNFAFRNAIKDAERERREYGTQPKQADIDRERDLRDAISLNYLKDKKEEEREAKNREKEAKPQNVMALKEALLGLLGDVAQKEPTLQNQPSATHVGLTPASPIVIPSPQTHHANPDDQHKERSHIDTHTHAHTHAHNTAHASAHTHTPAQSRQSTHATKVHVSEEHHVTKESVPHKEKEVDTKTIEQIFG
jgi:hypothetical protein